MKTFQTTAYRCCCTNDYFTDRRDRLLVSDLDHNLPHYKGKLLIFMYDKCPNCSAKWRLEDR